MSCEFYYMNVDAISKPMCDTPIMHTPGHLFNIIINTVDLSYNFISKHILKYLNKYYCSNNLICIFQMVCIICINYKDIKINMSMI